MSDESSVPLDLLERSALRKRARNVGIAAVIVGAACGGIVGVLLGPLGFFVTTGVLALPLLLLAYGESRKTYWLQGTEVAARAFGTRVVDLRAAEKLDVLVTDLRGMRTISLLVSGPPKGKTLNIAVAMYAGTGGKELGVHSLRRLADTLASTGDTRALVLSDLLVAQLKAEARGEAAAGRPLYRLASLAPQGRMAQRLRSEDVAKFVTTLD
ncbi:hypothetical protein DFQ14_10540 [Halopolyspora algeriensis]|uniref:Uncharacterized protein n=1 Tax=Halopolyspora algeriensis TaxID=1500506 RepID=A0A368VPX3_9ACTN|nr:hypothetical protein [Halopolyspora algeriensis]RCW43899.1 hypothetical protein DFQ14_10540 [Halopolyspora algeriensis]TQM53598.1 hypothetical protein FHU43_1759 [Halopolyspora algeriensis]